MSIVEIQHPDNSSTSTTTHHHEDEEEIVQLQEQLDVANKNDNTLKERLAMRNREIQNKSNYKERLEKNQKTLWTLRRKPVQKSVQNTPTGSLVHRYAPFSSACSIRIG